MTGNRKLIKEIIMSSMEHMTAEEIYMKAKQEQPSIAVGTVYRNLGLMTEAGEIRRLIMQDAPDRYDKSPVPHEHLVCIKCGKLSDISVTGLKDYVEKQTGIEIEGYDLNLRHICDECRKKAGQ